MALILFDHTTWGFFTPMFLFQIYIYLFTFKKIDILFYTNHIYLFTFYLLYETNL